MAQVFVHVLGQIPKSWKKVMDNLEHLNNSAWVG